MAESAGGLGPGSSAATSSSSAAPLRHRRRRHDRQPACSRPRAMIGMMERCSSVLAYEHLPEGKATVGFEVCIKHVAAAAEGATCRASARPCARWSKGASCASTSR